MLQNVHFANNHTNIHCQFISIDIALLLVVNCKFDNIINRNQCNNMTWLLYV